MKDIISKSEERLKSMHAEVERRVDPIRQNAFARFPMLFTLLVTFGVAAVFFGFESLIAKSVWLTNNPLAIIALGVLVLYGTGKLFHKLD